jgi:signal transduction histidine kinase/CheY-like chemotaxis protein
MKLGFWTLRRKLIVLLMLASTLPLAVNGYLIYARGRDLLEENARLRLATVADGVADQIDGLNERYFAVLGGLGRLPAIRAACDALAAGRDPDPYATEVISAFAESDLGLRAIGLLDRTGTVRSSNIPAYVGVDLGLREYFVAAQRRRGPAVELVVATRHAQPVPSLGYAQAFGDGACTIAFGVDADDLTERIRHYNNAIGDGSYVQIADQYGIRIAHSVRDDFAYVPTGPLTREERDAMVAAQRFGEPTAVLLDHPIAAPEQYRRARAESLRDLDAVYESWAAGNRELNLTAARRMTTAPWTIFVMVPTRTIEAPVGALLARATPIILGLVVTAFGFGLVLVQRIIAPVRRLTEAAGRLAAGKEHVDLVPSTRDELATLGHAFNEMAGAVTRATEQLEYKVADRTQALTAKTAVLDRHREELLAQRGELVAQKEELRAQRDELERKNAEIERADRMKSEFLANMSHELRTPLNSVIGFADLLQVTAEGRLGPDEQDHLRDIVAAGRHLLLIINDILDLAKIEAGHVRLELEAVDPGEVVAGAVAMVQTQARDKQLELRTTIRARRAARADGDRLRQILLNLLSNGVKFSPEGAAIDVRVDDRDDWVVFEVIDRGPGIPAELAAQLFQPFVQGEGSLVKRHQGTGLGLAICKRLVELHGGTIELDTRVGEGTSFRVLVPAAGRRNQDGHQRAAATVMLVVASASNRPHRARLEAAGYRVESVAPDADLGAEVRRVGAAVIVIDVHDAGGDANGILERVGLLATTTPVVLLGNEPELLVPKPIDAEPLRALCRRLVAGDGERPRVLVIDDDPRVAGLVAASLGPRYAIEAALTAADGLRRARGERFALHVVDLALPDGSGFDVLAALAGEDATRAIPRIVLTAAQLDRAQLEQLRRFAQAVAPKGSVTPEELLGVVDRLVAPVVEAAPRDGRPTVLVVDDHDMNRDLARSILERLGYRVVQARDGAEAIAVAERVQPSLILMDLAMPGIDGFTATRQLKAHPQLHHVPIAALSALAMKADEDRARAAGADAFLTKPIDRLALERTVARLLAE